jgi:hypothetical protein
VNEPAGDYALVEVKPNHWVGLWRTEAVKDRRDRRPDLQFRKPATAVTAV